MVDSHEDLAAPALGNKYWGLYKKPFKLQVSQNLPFPLSYQQKLDAQLAMPTFI